MNIRFFERLMQEPPKTPQEKYIFFVDSPDLAVNIAYCGFSAQAILDGQQDEYFTAESFIQYMRTLDEKLLHGIGTDRIQYVYVLACKKWNSDKIKAYLESSSLTCLVEWKLFKGKDYLSRVDRLDDLKQVLQDFFLRVEGPPDPEDSHDIARFHTFNERGVPNGIKDREIVDFLISRHPMFVVSGTPYLYQSGVYRQDPSGSRTRALICQLVYRELQKSPAIRRVYDLLVDQPSLQQTLTGINLQPRHWVNFTNGYFDFRTWKMVPHDPKYLTVNQIPYEFDPEKVPPSGSGNAVCHFLDVSLADEVDQEAFWEFLGYSMTADTCFQKSIMIRGPGGTGKSVLISLMEHLVGPENCTSITIQDLNKRFYATELFGMLLNACADIPSSAMLNVDVLKKAVGEDMLLYEKKGKDPAKFFSYAKLIFSANEMPANLDDKTNAYYRRMIVLNMDHIVSEEEKDRDLKQKLFADSEFCIYRAMFALKTLYGRGAFPESSGSREAIEELHRSTDSVKAFLDEMTVREDGAFTKRHDVYEAYCSYCNENDRKAHGKSVFFRYMRDKGLFTQRKAEGVMYMNLRLKNPDEIFDEDGVLGEETENGFREVKDTSAVPFEQGNERHF